MNKTNLIKSRGYANAETENKLHISIECNDKPVFWQIVKDIKSTVRFENYKRKQVGKSRLEYKIENYSSAKTVS
jgi:hypothetical protein